MIVFNRHAKHKWIEYYFHRLPHRIQILQRAGCLLDSSNFRINTIYFTKDKFLWVLLKLYVLPSLEGEEKIYWLIRNSRSSQKKVQGQYIEFNFWLHDISVTALSPFISLSLICMHFTLFGSYHRNQITPRPRPVYTCIGQQFKCTWRMYQYNGFIIMK